jgi:hypothetical protein
MNRRKFLDLTGRVLLLSSVAELVACKKKGAQHTTPAQSPAQTPNQAQQPAQQEPVQEPAKTPYSLVGKIQYDPIEHVLDRSEREYHLMRMQFLSEKKAMCIGLFAFSGAETAEMAHYDRCSQIVRHAFQHDLDIIISGEDATAGADGCLYIDDVQLYDPKQKVEKEGK